MAENPINNGQESHEETHVTAVSGLYENYFLDYASYVILERAVPLLDDGLKPVQRRILHALKEMDDGRFHKVANVIGQTMQFHPHGDAAIGDAMVNIGQKELLIDTQGNWGDSRTGDRAAASRYIETRLSKFGLHVAFNPKITEWQLSYDGRKKEPVSLPMKFPLVLAQGVEGIAVGLSTKIMPHNFVELIKASIQILKGRKTKLLPDFPTGGMMDASNYQGGKRGGKLRVRGHIEVQDKSTLLVKSIPYSTTTTSLIDSIIKANDKGKIKIKKVVDNTAQDVEIQIDLPSGISPDVTIDALYAFTDCEVSISPNACLILDDTPVFLTVDEILKLSTDRTRDLLRQELEITLAELREKYLFSSLEKIFIENRIYRDIEECETWEAVLETIDKGLEPYKPQFYREITEDDITRLTEIRIKRISKFNSFKADELMRQLQEDIEQNEHHLANLTDYAIEYFEDLLKKFGKDRGRKTEITTFDNIQVQQVAVANQKLYVNYKEGFVGYGLKKDEGEYLKDCSDLDDLIVFRSDGKYIVTKVQDKAFVGKNILHVDVWKKGNERKVYHAIYRDPVSSKNYIKRFAVTAITRDREYDVTNGAKGAKLIYFTAHENSEAEVVTVYLTQNCRAKNKVFDFDFSELAIKGRSSQGNVLTKYPIRRIAQKSVGASTQGGLKIWYDETVGRLNVDGRGQFLGEFEGEDSVMVIHKDGSYELLDYELTHRFDLNKTVLVSKFNPEQVITAVHYDGESKQYYVKRFTVETTTRNKPFLFISEADNSKLVLASVEPNVHIQYFATIKGTQKEEVQLNLSEFIGVKGWRATGNKLDKRKVTRIKQIEVEMPAENQGSLQTGDSVEWSGDDVNTDSAQTDLFE
ncbi:DNA gyrase/topoisomerase IV subunit A [Pontibacter sp. G13]|uniref:DNA gyrase/topoisomerase IV subunit A n=1 Tax=Pontibacter sp. G13 TaxID=3074898 RepID=UPI00288C4609|nr:DNA gyrase/topoisomerase IV subunit A [Pontibacter sp. G13]WNJ21476.1 DNA gyrase/topoisomerase IV subunit A [Pontibacter sp. G13]